MPGLKRLGRFLNYMDIELAKTFADIQFVSEIQDIHQYFVAGEEYISVSSFLDTLQKPFNKELMSKKVANRDGVPQDEIKQQWDLRRDFSIMRGTEFHFYVETYLRENRKLETVTPIDHEIKQFHEFWGKYKNHCELLATELSLYDKNLKLAGTLDCLLRHKKSQKVYIFDWKTNSKIKRENKYQNFLAPIEHLDISDINKYSLQTGLYKYILENNTPLKVAGSYLIHFQKSKPFESISCKSLSQEIKNIVSLRRHSLNEGQP